jgi:hypothetical protein
MQQNNPNIKKLRWLWINVWRPITESPCVCTPLAICDTQSTQDSYKYDSSIG